MFSGWRSVVKVGGIDCAEETNIPICREYEIMGYPTMLFFPPKSPETKVSSVYNHQVSSHFMGLNI